MTRFESRIAWWIAPLLFVMGVTPARCFIEVSASELRVRHGWLFDRRFARVEVAAVGAMRLPWYYGPGVHIDLRGSVFVTGAYGEGIAIEFSTSQPVSWLYGRRCRRLVVTPKDPAALLAALGGGAA